LINTCFSCDRSPSVYPASTNVVSGLPPTLPSKQREMHWVHRKRYEVPIGGASLPLLLVCVKARTTAHSLVSTPY